MSHLQPPLMTIEQPRTAGDPPETTSVSSLPPSRSPAQWGTPDGPSHQATPFHNSFHAQSSSPAQREPAKKQPHLFLFRSAPRSGAPPSEAASSDSQSSSPAQRGLPHLQPRPSSHQAAPRSGSSPNCCLVHPPIEQPRAAEAPPFASSSLPNRAAPRSGSSPICILLPPPFEQPRAAGLPHLKPRPSSHQAAPRSGSSPICSLVHPPIGQPRAAEAPPFAASSLPNRAAPRSGSSPICILLPPPFEQPRAAGAPPFEASSILPSSSPTQRKLPHLQPRPSPHRAAPRSGGSPICSLAPPQIEQPRAAGAPPEAALSFPPKAASSSLLNRAAPRSGSSPKSSLFLPSVEGQSPVYVVGATATASVGSAAYGQTSQAESIAESIRPSTQCLTKSSALSRE